MQLLSIVFILVSARAPKKAEDARALAEKYLLALTDGHDQSGKDYLFGGLTLDAVTASALQPEITAQGPKRQEEGVVEETRALLQKADAAGKLTSDLGEAQAQMDKSKDARKELGKRLSVFADVVRTDRPLYWHPKNPMRVALAEAQDGPYKLEYILFTVRSRDTDGRSRTWPLRTVRFTNGDKDSGWRVLPASQWDPE